MSIVTWSKQLWTLAGYVTAGAFAGVIGMAVLALPREAAGLTEDVANEMARSGVEHMVTAVLLNFRSYDTWLETVVLLLAVLGLLAARRSLAFDTGDLDRGPYPALVWLAKLTAPIVLLASTYLFWKGTHAPGGAFQAGAVAGAGLVLLHLAGPRWVPVLHWRWRAALALAVAAFSVAGIWTMGHGGALLEFGPEHAGAFILMIEAAIGVATAITLAVLFIGNAPAHAESHPGKG